VTATQALQWLGVTLHVLGAAGYIGGSIAMEFVLAPAQKAIPPAQAMVVGEKTADRFIWIAWGSLLLLLLGALIRLQWGGAGLTMIWGLGTDYGRTVFVKALLWVVLVVNGAIITFVLRPKLMGKMSGGTTAAQAQQSQQLKGKAARQIMILTRVDLGIMLVVMVLGTSLRSMQGIL